MTSHHQLVILIVDLPSTHPRLSSSTTHYLTFTPGERTYTSTWQQKAMAHDKNNDDDDDEYFLPLEDQRVFGAGIKRKRVPFIKSSTTSNLETTNHSLSAPATASTSPAPPTGGSIGDKYLSIVLPSSTSSSVNRSRSSNDSEPTTTSTITCDICNLPLTPNPNATSGTTDRPDKHPHESSLAHQVCLPHSHPPSAIDRRRTGYKYLASYGWDPDSRRGLGPEGQGIQFPLKSRAKNDTVGLGVKLSAVPKGKSNGVGKKKTEQLNAKQVRKKEEEKRRQGERLGEMFYQSDDVQRYLGT